MPRLKSLSDQTIVITGASSGIGLATARMADRKGARVVLAARSEEALRQLANEITSAGGEAIYVEADVSREEDVQKIVDAASSRFGGFDTWVNNAGVSIYGKLLDIPVADMRRLVETNLWGVVHGSLAAARHFRSRGGPGAIINIGSVLSDRAIPLQGIYCASKHAVKAFTDVLRMELDAERVPISVTLIKPGVIDTPYYEHARNYMGADPVRIPPVYAPEAVAEAILHCAQHPKRDLFVGASAKSMSMMGHYTPAIADRMMASTIEQQKSDAAPQLARDGLYHAAGELRERGGYSGHVAQSSLYTKTTMHPFAASAIAVGAGLAFAALWRARNSRGAPRFKG
jgi:short-subunit dehydrogenase